MTSGIRSIVNFFIYSSIIISIAATTFTLEAFFLLELPIDCAYTGFVFCATLLTYSVHRIVGIRKLKEELIEGRFKVIRTYKSHIIIYTLLSFCGTIYFTSKLNHELILYLIFPAIISALYTIPILSGQKRLRDFNFIKIILISLVWSLIAIIPFVNDEINFSGKYLILLSFFIEKGIYIFAITLPFDIRDERIEKHAKVKTFPSIWGHKLTYQIITILLVTSALILTFNSVVLLKLNWIFLIYIAIAYGLSQIAITISKGKKSDLYYSGLLDGIIIMRSIILITGISLI